MSERPLRLLPALFGSAAALALVASGCGSGPFDSATRTRPAPVDVAGTWVLDEAGDADARSAMKAGRVPAFVFREDGTFTARDLPDWWNDIDRLASNGGPGATWVPTSGSGRWELRQDGNGAWVLETSFPVLPGLPRGLKETLHLYRNKPPYRLGVILGDPDEARSLHFERSDARPVPSPDR